MGTTSIEWTATVNPDGTITPGKTWTPIQGRVREDALEIATRKNYTSLLPIIKPGRVGPHCEHASDGCKNCYAERDGKRCRPHNGTGLPFDRRSRDLLNIVLNEKLLLQPLSWKASRKIFVCSQTDLFGEFVPDEFIDRVMAVMGLCELHTFLVLTKRAERMRQYMTAPGLPQRLAAATIALGARPSFPASRFWRAHAAVAEGLAGGWRLPLNGVWLGVSVEDQLNADKRIAELILTPAAKRFVSYEPALAEVDFTRWIKFLDWIIFGGESGPGARPCNIDWARNTKRQCSDAGIAFFLKQLGRHPYDAGTLPGQRLLKNLKGGDPAEWPEELRSARGVA